MAALFSQFSADSLNDTDGLYAISDSLVVDILFFSQTILTLTCDIVQLYLLILMSVHGNYDAVLMTLVEVYFRFVFKR